MWDDSTKASLVVLMVIGGSYGSTSSAIKLVRVAVFIWSFRWIIKKLSAPKGAVIPIKLGGKVYDEHEVMEALLFTMLYLTFLIVGAILMSLPGFRFIDSLFEVASAQGNVGLSVGLVNPSLHIFGKNNSHHGNVGWPIRNPTSNNAIPENSKQKISLTL